MTLNGVMAVILRYFSEIGIFRKSMVEDVVVKKFTFAISSPDELLVYSALANRNDAYSLRQRS